MKTKMQFLLMLAAWTFLPLLATAKGDGKMMPIINSDNTVTFQLKAPNAADVFIKGSFIPRTHEIKTKAGTFGKAGKAAMKEVNGVWTYTTPELASELYTYSFEVDGIEITDPQNINIIRDVDRYENYFIIEGNTANDYLVRDVPHGTVAKVWYKSTLNGMKQRRMTVYTPAGYEANNTRRYPVLYLLHGSGGDENAWVEAGRAAQIMDNMIAQKQTPPMIVVMPNGIADEEAAPGESTNYTDKPSAMNVESMLGNVEKAFVNDIVTYIDNNYRTQNDKAHRAIAGLSLGGLQTIYISANNPTMFDYIGLFSAQATNAMNDKRIDLAQKLSKLGESVSDIPIIGNGKLGEKLSRLAGSTGNLDIYGQTDDKLEKQFANAPKLYYIAVGTDDFVKKLNDDFRAKLDAAGYKFHYHETDGGHTWENWRKYLRDFLPRLFK